VIQRAKRCRSERGAALVEFALVSLVLYLLLAGTIEFGRLVFGASALQDVARVAARELAVAPLRANVTFEYALSCDPTSDPNCLVDLKRRVFDPACLVVDLTDPAVAADPDGYFAAMPVVNRSLRTLMISEPSRPNLLRYPGALLTDDAGAQCSAAGPGGAAGPTGNRYGDPAGHSCIAVTGPVDRAITVETGSSDRVANMRVFAAAALDLLAQSLASSPAARS